MGDDENESIGGRAFPESQNGMPQNANERALISEVNSEFMDDDDDDTVEEFKAIPPIKHGKALDIAIVKGVEKIIDLKAQRQLINSQIKEVVESLEGQGILRDALKDTIKKMEWTDAKRESYLLGCTVSGNALGIMEQTELSLVS